MERYQPNGEQIQHQPIRVCAVPCLNVRRSPPRHSTVAAARVLVVRRVCHPIEEDAECRKFRPVNVDDGSSAAKNRSLTQPAILGKRRILTSGSVVAAAKPTHGPTGRKTGRLVGLSACYSLGVNRQSQADGIGTGCRGNAELNLYCTESLSSSRAADDRKRVDGNGLRVLNGLMDAESGYQLLINPYDGSVQPEINEPMRAELATWIYEVCEYNCCNCGVFPFSMYLVDRFLSLLTVHRRVRASEYQLIGAVCLFIASKFIDCSEDARLSATQVVRHTDNSISRDQLLEWELIILMAFNWDVFAITPFDFVDHIICHLPLGGDTVTTRVRHHAVTFVALCTHDVNFSINHPPSTIATACLRHAIGVTLGEDWCRQNRIDRRLYEITHTEPDYVTACRDQIERSLFDRYTAGLQSSGSNESPASPIGRGDDPKARRTAPDTPTDIRDISPISEPSSHRNLSAAGSTCPVKIC